MELGPQERAFIDLLCSGLRVCQAAQRMGITPRDASHRLAHIRAKAGCRTMFGLALWCVKKGYIK